MSSTFAGARVAPSGRRRPGDAGSIGTGAVGAASPALGGGLESARAAGALSVAAPVVSRTTSTAAAGFMDASPLRVRERDLGRRHGGQVELDLVRRRGRGGELGEEGAGFLGLNAQQ